MRRGEIRRRENVSGRLVVYTARPPGHWDFEAYNTNTEFVIEGLLRPTGFAKVTVKHKSNCVRRLWCFGVSDPR